MMPELRTWSTLIDDIYFFISYLYLDILTLILELKNLKHM